MQALLLVSHGSRRQQSNEEVVLLCHKLRGLMSGEFDREAILANMENLAFKLRETGREIEEDVVLDVMDFLIGWCSPHMSL